MIEPGQHFADGVRDLRQGQGRAIDHDDRQAERTRRIDLRTRALPARIFGDDQLYPLRAHQGEVALQREGTAIHDQIMTGQRGRLVRRIDEAEQIMMLRLGSEGHDMHTAERQHDAARLSVERGHGACYVSDTGPAVALPRFPGRAGQHHVSGARLLRRLSSMSAHGSGKGMCRVDQMRDRLLLQIGGKARNAAKATNTDGHWLRPRGVRASGIAQHRAVATLGKRLCKSARLSGPAQDEDVAHGC
jgi:hypothetical protein